MFEPVRGGTRGGQAEFKWSDVSADKDRENYLGHSINAPTGRWQKNKDIHWYNRDVKQAEQDRLDEIKRIKEQEAEALSAALGFGPAKPVAGAATGANATAVAPKPGASASPAVPSTEESAEEKARRKEEKRRRKEERRARKAEKEKEKKRAERHRDSRSRSPGYGRRERSPVYGRRDRSWSRERRYREDERRRSRTPPRRERDVGNYDIRERERERDRRRWEDSAKREAPGGGRRTRG